MAIQLLSLPTLVGGATPGYPGYINTVTSKINELATVMSISALTLNAMLGAGSPASDFNTLVAKVNELIGAVNGGGGTALSFAPASADYSNNLRNTNVGGTMWHNSYARFKVTASGAGTGTLGVVGHGFAPQVEVQKNGVHYATLNGTKIDTLDTLSFSIDGPGVYTFIEGQQTSPGDAGNVYFTTIIQANFSANVGASKLPVTRASKLLIVRGDSISVGGYSPQGARYGWPVLLQPLLTDTDVIAIGWGGKRGYNDMADANSRAALLALVAPICQLYSEVLWWDQNGENDYNAGSIAPATWAQATKDGLIYLRSNIANLTKIYWASPTTTATRGAGPSGATPQQFQAAVQPATAGVGSWLIYTDGNTLGVNGSTSQTAVGSTVDGVHPNDPTYVLMSQRIAAVLSGVTASPEIYRFVPTSGVAADGSSWGSTKGSLVFSQADASKRATFTSTAAVFNGGQVYVSNSPAFAALSSLSILLEIKNLGAGSKPYQEVFSQTYDAQHSIQLVYGRAEGALFLQVCTAAGGNSGSGAGKRFRTTALAAGANAQIYANITPGSGDYMTLIVNGQVGADVSGASGIPSGFNNEPITFMDGVAGNVTKVSVANKAYNASELQAYFS
jgi:hypothetical protein